MKSLTQQPLSDREMETVPSLEEMKAAFNTVSQSRFKGVPGVLKIDSPHPNNGPTVGITIGTHGNEIAGLAPLVQYIRNERLGKLLQTGSVIFTLNNMKAMDKFFKAESDSEKRRLRQLNHNMNRLPEDILELKTDTRYEIQRILELYPIFQEFDAALDIHSTYGPSVPMIVEVKGGLDLLNGAPIPTVLTNMLNVQRGLPASGLYGGIDRENIPVLGIEAGMQGAPDALVSATQITQAFLQNMGMIPGKPSSTYEYERKIYRVSQPLMFPDYSYEFVKRFLTFEAVKEGQIIAEGDGPALLAPQDGHILFPKPKAFNTKMDEAAFISDPVKDN